MKGSLSAWDCVPLKRLALLASGEGIATEEIEPEGEYPVFGGNGIRGYTDSFTHRGSHPLIGRQGALCGNVHLATGAFWASEHAVVVSPRADVDARWLAYALLHMDLGRHSMTAAQPGLAVDFIRGLLVPVPESERRQGEIADFLDRETAKIDALIAKQARLVQGVGERVDARWAREVETLVEVSSVVPLRRVVESIVDGPFGSSLTSAHYSHYGARVIRLGNVGMAYFRNEDQAYIPEQYARQLDAHAALPGDVVVAGLGDDRWPLGRATVVPDLGGPAIVKADCYRIRPRSTVNAEYLAWVLSSPPLREQFQLMSRGSTRSRLNTQVVRDALIPLPSLDVQRRVTWAYQAARKRHNDLRAALRRLEMALRERRAALITAAVTGRLDVTTYGKVG